MSTCSSIERKTELFFEEERINNFRNTFIYSEQVMYVLKDFSSTYFRAAVTKSSISEMPM